MSENNKNHIFRQKSLDRVSSPEQLDKYIKSTNPSLWVLLIAIIVLLCGTIVWGTIGKIETKSSLGVSVNNGETLAYIPEKYGEKIDDESFVLINEQKYKITKLEGPFLADIESDSFLLRASNLSTEDWYYIITIKTNLSDGQYKGTIVYETISPITFIIN